MNCVYLVVSGVECTSTRNCRDRLKVLYDFRVWRDANPGPRSGVRIWTKTLAADQLNSSREIVDNDGNYAAFKSAVSL